MKHSKNNTGSWKTDRRIAFVPPVILTSMFIMLCFFVKPAFSFELVEPNDAPAVVQNSAEYSCMSLLNSAHSSRSVPDRNQRAAGDKAAAFGMVLGVRFALSPTEVMPLKQKPRLGVWQTQGYSVDDRSALAVSAYRDCQKKQALQALNGVDWAR